MKPTLSEETEKRFKKEKRSFEIYGPLGMGIAYPKLKQFIAEVEAAAEERGRLKGVGEERERLMPYIECANNWITEAADFTHPICTACGSEAFEDSDGLEDTPDAHLGHSWKYCSNDKCDNDSSDRSKKYRDYPAEAQGLIYEYNNIKEALNSERNV